MAISSQIRCRPFTRTIPPGGDSSLEVVGTFFRVKEASGEFEIGLDEGPMFSFDLGLAYHCTAGDSFKAINLHNPTADAVTVEILVGVGSIVDDRLNLVSERGSISTMEAPTILRVVFAGTLAATTTQLLDPAAPSGYTRRKGFVVTNGSAELRAEILDDTGALADIVQPTHSKFYPVTAAVSVRNPHGAGIEIFASAVWWKSLGR